MCIKVHIYHASKINFTRLNGLFVFYQNGYAHYAIGS